VCGVWSDPRCRRSDGGVWWPVARLVPSWKMGSEQGRRVPLCAGSVGLRVGIVNSNAGDNMARAAGGGSQRRVLGGPADGGRALYGGGGCLGRSGGGGVVRSTVRGGGRTGGACWL